MDHTPLQEALSRGDPHSVGSPAMHGLSQMPEQQQMPAGFAFPGEQPPAPGLGDRSTGRGMAAARSAVQEMQRQGLSVQNIQELVQNMQSLLSNVRVCSSASLRCSSQLVCVGVCVRA